MAQLKEFYKKEVVSVLTEKFGYKNPMRVPKITKVVLNMGLGEAVTDKKVIESATSDLAKIAGQKVVVTKARKSIAGFKIREGWPVGCKVTLRGERMYEFLERLVGIAIPRIRDFRGLSPKAFDGRGNYAMGVTEQIIFDVKHQGYLLKKNLFSRKAYVPLKMLHVRTKPETGR